MKLTIKNYQGHEESELEFISPGINAITGPNGHGKSSVIRAMKAVPLGDTLDRRHGTKETRVEIDGCAKVFKGKGRYEIDGNSFEALRNHVPREVFQKLKLSDLNFRSQHQPYFLLSDSPGAVARAMNELTDLGVIDYVSSELKSEGRVLEDKRKALESDLAAERGKVTRLDWAVEADEDLKVIEQAQETLQELNSQLLKLQESISCIFEYQEKLSKLPPETLREDFERRIKELENIEVAELTELIRWSLENKAWLDSVPVSMEVSLALVTKTLSELPEISTLEDLIDKVTEYALDLRVCPDPKPDIERLGSFEFEEYDDLEDLVSSVSSLALARNELQKIEGWMEKMKEVRGAVLDAETANTRVESLSELLEETVGLVSSVDKAKEVCYKAKEEFDSLLRETGTCPLCGGATDETCVHS